MDKAKKKWVQPELIVLVRRKPEERVLDGCKTGHAEGPENVDWGCVTYVDWCTGCDNYSAT
jgi:hypothetical protein